MVAKRGGAEEPRSPLWANGCIACVVDSDPRFHLDALRWFACLTEVAHVDASDLVVHAIGPLDSEPLRHLASRGVAVRPIETFDDRSPHCNKIAGAIRLARDATSGTVVLTDADTAILDDPRVMQRPEQAVSAKTVDSPLPPLDVLALIFDTAGMRLPPEVSLHHGSEQRTIGGNCNGGVYLLEADLLHQVAASWATWARWLLDRRELLGDWAVHVDQVAMALALAAEAIEWHSLDPDWNTPTHYPALIPDGLPHPHVLHYHWEVDHAGLLKKTGTAVIDSQIDVANDAIARVFDDAKPDATLRRWRADTSTRTLPNDTRGTIAAVAASLGQPRVLEVANNGRSVTDGLTAPARRVTTSELEELIATGAPAHSASDIGPSAHASDLTVALGALEDLGSRDEYRRLVKTLWKSTSSALMVSGFIDSFGARNATNRYHEPLRHTLHAVAPDAELYPIAATDSIETVVALRPPAQGHPRDFGTSTLASLIDRIPNPLSLLAMRLLARRTIGFYPDHSPRLWEYPVVANLVSEHLAPGSRVVDIGAGVSPLAPFLHSSGYLVDTVDPSPIRREWSAHTEWNEWGFLDYAAADLATASWNCTLDQLPTQPLFDGVCSVSVVEHLPAKERRALLSEISARTRTGGLVVLTIDLQPGTDDLWNYNRGDLVDRPSRHGDLSTVVEECAAAGLELFEEERVRDWPATHVEIGLLALRQRRSAPPNRRQSFLRAFRLPSFERPSSRV